VAGASSCGLPVEGSVRWTARPPRSSTAWARAAVCGEGGHPRAKSVCRCKPCSARLTRECTGGSGLGGEQQEQGVVRLAVSLECGVSGSGALGADEVSVIVHLSVVVVVRSPSRESQGRLFERLSKPRCTHTAQRTDTREGVFLTFSPSPSRSRSSFPSKLPRSPLFTSSLPTQWPNPNSAARCRSGRAGQR